MVGYTGTEMAEIMKDGVQTEKAREGGKPR
jgi:hypothetical protein